MFCVDSICCCCNIEDAVGSRHGPIEVMSKQAMQVYNDRWMQCQIVAQQKPQEAFSGE